MTELYTRANFVNVPGGPGLLAVGLNNRILMIKPDGSFSTVARKLDLDDQGFEHELSSLIPTGTSVFFGLYYLIDNDDVVAQLLGGGEPRLAKLEYRDGKIEVLERDLWPTLRGSSSNFFGNLDVRNVTSNGATFVVRDHFEDKTTLYWLKPEGFSQDIQALDITGSPYERAPLLGLSQKGEVYFAPGGDLPVIAVNPEGDGRLTSQIFHPTPWRIYGEDLRRTCAYLLNRYQAL